MPMLNVTMAAPQISTCVIDSLGAAAVFMA
jgi:hypothetical protein